MPLVETVTLLITCDNPACPGNNLDPADRMGWRFVTYEKHGQGNMKNAVFCTLDCLSAATADLGADEAADEEFARA